MSAESSPRAGGDAHVHRALASPVRNRILAVMRAGGSPYGVHELAEQLGLHVNTVRAHLVILEKAGLVASEREERRRPGRPRLVYRVIRTADDEHDDAERATGYRFLAEILAGYLTAVADDPTAAAEDAGSTWGHYLVERPGPFEKVDPAAAVQRILEMLEELGFAPELDDHPTGPRLLLRRCPFLDVAKEHPQVVCGIHLGLMRGALAELGVSVEARDLRPFVEPGLCVSHLRMPA